MKFLWLLIISCTFSNAFIQSFEYDYSFGNVAFSCMPGWTQLRDSCYKLTSEWLPWNESNILCASERYNNSHAIVMHNWFLTRDLSRSILESNGTYWTALYYQQTPDAFCSTTSLNSAVDPDPISIYNPLWASTQPHLQFNQSFHCLSLTADFSNDLIYGWFLRNCSQRLPTICQTFACLEGREYRCNDNSRCYPIEARCDGIQDCMDNSDEDPNTVCKTRVACQDILLEAPQGEIFLPDNYRPGSECRWKIQQKQDARIKLTMSELNINEHDVLSVGGVSNSSEPEWDRLLPSSASNFQQWISDNNTLVIAFKSASNSDLSPPKGFHFRYSVQAVPNCVETLRTSNGTIVIPKTDSNDKFYAPNLNCHWTIISEHNNLISIQIPYFSLANNDSLKIFDGNLEERNLLGVFVNKNPPPMSTVSSSSQLHFLFTSQPHSVGSRGFEIHFRQGCLNEKLLSNNGDLETPGARLASNRRPFHCSWTIEIPCKRHEDCAFSIYFHKLKMTENDAITIQAGSKLRAISANNLPPTRLRAISSRVILDIHSNSADLVVALSYSKDCPPLNLDPNVLVMYSHSNEYNSLAQLSCKSGFVLIGEESLQCKKGGKWSAKTPTCQATFCPMPFIENGYLLNITGFQLNSSLEYGCQLGYNASSVKQSLCEANAMWNPQPLCQPIDCGDPESTYNNAIVNRTSRGTALFSRTHYSCPQGMHLIGTSAPYRICQATGKWSVPNFGCQATGCYATSIMFGKYNQPFFANGSIANYSCVNGFIPKRSPPLCINGSLSHNESLCQNESFCKSNPCGHGSCVQLFGNYTCKCENGYQIVSRNGYSTCEDIDECNTAGYSLCDQTCINTPGSYYCKCREGYWLYGSNDVNQRVNLTFNTKFLIKNHSCILKRCPTPNVPENAYKYPYWADKIIVANGLYPIGFSLTFQCNNSGNPVSFTTLRCSSDGSWQQTNRCQTNLCLWSFTASSQLNIEPNRTFYIHNDVVNFSCQTPYRLIGPTHTICQTNNVWSIKTLPVCAIQRCSDIAFSGTIFVAEHHHNMPSNVPGYRALLICKNGYHFENGEQNITIKCNENYEWSRTSIPRCIPKTCLVNESEQLVPLKKVLLSGESTSFNCQQSDYYLAGTSSTTCAVNNTSSSLRMIETYDNCFSHISPETYASIGESAVLWCVVNERCANYTVSWRRSKSVHDELVTVKRGIFKYAVFFEKSERFHQDSYQCVVSSNGKIIDQKSTDFFVHSLREDTKSWMDTMNSAEPIKDNLFGNELSRATWNSSDDWERSFDGTWTYRYQAGQNYLIGKLFEEAPQWSTIVVKYKIKKCVSCTLHLKLLHGDTTSENDIAKFVTIAELFANDTSFRMRSNFGFVAFAIESNSPLAYLYSVNIYLIKCPPIKIGLVEFPETVAQQNLIEIAGKCVRDASTYDGSQPTLSCSSRGKWFSSQQLVSTCVCKDLHSTYHNKCVPRGPICYNCSADSICDATSAIHCDVGQSCFTDASLHSNGVLKVTKGCSDDCRGSVIDLDQCIHGEQSCHLCCTTDYCNQLPYPRQFLQLKGDTPICVDAKPMSVQCIRQLSIPKYTNTFVSPVLIPFPIVYDNDPYYTVTSNVPLLGSKPYSVDSDMKEIVWNITDRHQNSQTCTTRLIYEDRWPPMLICPELYEDYMSNTTSSTVLARLPMVDWVDASDVHLMYEPFNGSSVQINEPIRVTVTAVDQHGNIAKCKFWYVARVSDCPLWPVNETEYQCSGSLNERTCKRINDCDNEYPSGIKALTCALGAGWSYAFSYSSSQMIRSPVCISGTRPAIAVSMKMELVSNRNICVALLTNEIYAKLMNITKQICANNTWQRSEYLTNHTILTIDFISHNINVGNGERCARKFVQSIEEDLTTITDICEGLQIHSRFINYSVSYGEEHCPSGFYSSATGCLPCPIGTYSDREGLKQCQQCPPGSSTSNLGSFSIKLCYERCPSGYYSETGLTPCRACPKGFFQSNNASKECLHCRPGSTTALPGASSETDCAEECMPGWFSQNGLQPCIACPFGFYQSKTAQWTCDRCPEGTTTFHQNATSIHQCRIAVCDDICHPKSVCVDGKCKCDYGYAGYDCGVALNLCHAEYCLNEGRCSFDGNSTTCHCEDGFTGKRCEKHITSPELPHRMTSPCFNISLCSNGACISTGHSYICECNDGFKNAPHSKQICIPMDSCDFLSCANAACPHITQTTISCPHFQAKASKESNCTNDGIKTLTGSCLCPPEYTGSNCSMKFNICTDMMENSLCGDGKCDQFSNELNSYYFCECNNGTFGEYCQTSAPCNYDLSTTPKCNYGSCKITNKKASCVCSEGFDGMDCSTPVEHCRSNPCQHGGTCYDTFNGPFCSCPSDYEGDFCEQAISPCMNDTCVEEGHCTAISMGHDGKYNCSCKHGWKGPRCAEDVDACVNNNCSLQSECVDVLGDTYKCLCPFNRRGSFCELPVEFCSLRNPCFNYGTCTDIQWGYDCSCPPGYGGKNCESILDHCDPNPCQNNGICRSNILGYYCECLAEYEGLNCSVRVNPCKINATMNYCMNGATCYVEGIVARCRCTYEFVGDRCEIKKTQSYNLYFAGGIPSAKVVSIPFNSSDIFDEFSLCGWVKPRTQNRIQQSSEMMSTPFIVLFSKQTHNQSLISISCSGVQVNNTVLIKFTMKTGVWHQFCVRRNRGSIMNVFLNGQLVATSNESIGEMHPQLRILLGQSISGRRRFTGELSLIQLYKKAMSDAEIRNMAYNCQHWLHSQSENDKKSLIINWKEFTTIGYQDSSVHGLYPGVCVSSTCLPGQSESCSSVYDKIPPTVVNCPSNQYIVSEKRLTSVTWQPSTAEDIFTDNDLIVEVICNFRSGDVFTWGQYRVIYIASDKAGNIATCEFDIVVSPQNCTEPSDPYNGNKSTLELNSSDVARRAAFLNCRDGYLFATKMPAFFVCDIMGRWSRWHHPIQYRFPSCSAYKPPEQRLNGSVSVNDHCSNIEDIERVLMQCIAIANKRYGGAGFCRTVNCSGEVNISSNCAKRVKKSTILQRIELSYVLTINTTRSSIFHYVDTSMYEEYGNNSKSPTTEWSCKDPDYQMLLNGELKACVKCTIGYYLSNSTCIPCPENTYKDVEGNGPCKKCANGTVTGTTGATMEVDCYSNCTPGNYYNPTTSSCKQCERGTFQPEDGAIQCFPCKLGYSTAGTGSRSEKDCNVTCEGGFYMGVEELCVACPKGSFRPNSNETVKCISCNLGFTTPTTNCSSTKDCSVMNCPPGTYTNQSVVAPLNQDSDRLTDICLQCPIGYYQDGWNQSACVPCGTGFTTLNPGSSSVRYCILSMVTAPPKTAIASQEKHESAPWISWLIVSVAGAVAAIIVSSVVIVYRKRIRNLLYCCKNANLKTMTTTDYYRDTSYTYPIVTATSTVPQMIEIYNDIFTGLQKMADGSEDSRAQDFEDVDHLPPASLTVDTTLRAVEKYGPKAIGMDSSGFPIDSADYERFGYGREENENSNSYIEALMRVKESAWNNDHRGALRSRFEAISQKLHNDTSSANEWHENCSYNDGFEHDSNFIPMRDYAEAINNTTFEHGNIDGIEEDDDEDYFG